MFCSKCGSVNPDISTFCSTCGAPIPAATPGAPSPLSATPTPYATPGPYAASPYPNAGPYSATGQPVSPHWRPNPGIAYAGFWLRFVAYIVDNLIVGIPLAIVAVLFFFGAGGLQAIRELQPNEEPGPRFIAFLFAWVGGFLVVALISNWLYFAYFETSSWQGTPGKKMLNLYVTDLNGSAVTFGRASGRFFARIITRMIPLGIGYILAGVTEKRQALHDMIASCLVLRRY